MSRRGQGERGQTAIEYVGVLAAVVIVAALLIAAAPGWGQSLVCGVQNALHRIGLPVAGCGGSGFNADGTPTLDKCILGDESGKASASVNIAIVKLGGNATAVKQKRGDGTWAVTLSGGGEAGVEGGVGGGVKAEGKGWEVGGKAEAKGGANLQGEGGSTYIVDSEDRANELIDIYRNKVRDAAVEGAAGPIGGGVLGFVGDKLGVTEQRDLPKPDQTYVQGGVGLSGKAGAGPASAEASGSELLGSRTDNKTGQTTFYYKLDGKASAQANAAGGLGAGAGGDGNAMLAVVSDKSGKPMSMTLTRSWGYNGYAKLSPSLKNRDPEAFLKGLSLTGSDTSGHRAVMTQTIDFAKNPEGLTSLQNWADGAFSSPTLGIGDLIGAFDDNGAGTLLRYKTDESKAGGGASLALGLKVGAEGSYESKSSTLEGAEYWTPGGPVQEWAACSQ